MSIKRFIYIIMGCICMGLGALSAVLPLLPAFPFLLLAAFCFGKSSERLHTGLSAQGSTGTIWKAMCRAGA